MKESVYLNGILQMLLGLNQANKKWIADRLYESIKSEEEAKEHEAECFMLYSVFKQVKDLKEGRLQTRDVEELLNGY